MQNNKLPNEGLGCAVIIVVTCAYLALMVWAAAGFPGLSH